MPQNPPTAQHSTLSNREKLAFSLGGAQQNFGNLPKIIISPVYNVLLGVNPALIGLVLLMNRLGEAVWEPLIGLYADRRANRGGGYKQLLTAGGLLLMSMLPLIFLAQPGWSSTAKLVYLLLSSTLFCFGLSLFTVNLNSLLVSRTSGGSDRNSLAAWFTSGSIIAGFINNWMLPYILRDMSVQDGQVRLLTVTGAIALVMMAAIVGIRRWARESPAPVPQATGISTAIPVKRNSYKEILSVLGYRPFLVLLLVNSAAIFGSNIIAQFGFYVKGYYMFEGDVQRGAVWTGIAGSAFQIATLGCIPLFRWAADRLGNRNAMLIALGFAIVGEIIKWFVHKPGVDPLWLPVVATVLAPYGILSMLVLSMLGDVCDSDEAIQGRRRAGSMVGAMSLCTKFGLILTPVLSGLLLHWSGFDVALGAAQSQTALISMRIFYTAVPLTCIVFAFTLLWFFPFGPTARPRVTAAV